jgi:hypothetical protein
MIDVYRKYGHRTDLMVMFNCRSNKNQNSRNFSKVRQYLRLHHYSIHTERSYVDWIVRFIRFHRMRSRDDLFFTP